MTRLDRAQLAPVSVPLVLFFAPAVVIGAAACSDGTVAADSGSASDGAVADTGAPSDGATDAAGGDPYCPVVDYAACGGDLLGTWAFRSLCPDDAAAAAALCEHPFDDRDSCVGPGNEALCDGILEGTLTFNADGTVDVETVMTLIGTWNYTDDCLAAVATGGSTPEERCASLANERSTCTYEGACICVGDPFVEMDTNTASYSVVGDDVTLGEDPPASYCIAGDILTMDYYLFHPVSWRYWVLERQ